MQNKKLLLVAPDERDRERLTLRFSFLDLEVIQAENAEQAIRHLENSEPHLVVTEWPLEGGMEVQEFHQKLSSGQMFVIFCSVTPDEPTVNLLPAGRRYAQVPKTNRIEIFDHVEKFMAEIPTDIPNDRILERTGKVPRHFLIIEDSPTLRGLLRRALEKGFPGDIVREAEDGKQALNEMTRKKVDAIITDLEMPGMDGKTFLNHLKNNPILSKKPTLIYSSNITEELLGLTTDLARVRLLAKPASPEKILDEMTILLATHSA